MVCIYCSSPTNVVNSRHQKRTNSTWRRRKCIECSAIVSTVESIDLDSSVLFQQDNKQAPFIKEHLLLSIYESCRHRPTAVTDAIGLTNTVIAACMRKSAKPGIISRDTLVQTTWQTLDRFDHAASTHYSAFHRIKKA